ncbi:MAG: PQQ-binding-like beta-propeller repeat protein, partial [Pirellulales bacterium]|nr:PQQ-binding-like beta-propeller repeat protein [Pirellulales bacterium]
RCHRSIARPTVMKKYDPFLAIPCAIAIILGTSSHPIAAEAPNTVPIPNFCFLQISDIHLDPHPAGGTAPGPEDRSIEEIAWFCAEAFQPQRLEPSGIVTGVPSFTFVTGDLTEYGVIHQTWKDFQDLFERLDMPVFITPGNHDNTWTGMQHIMRARHGGDHYSFDRFGCHFIAFNTATPQEPVPTIEQRTLAWIQNDLAKVAKNTPIFLFCHHPLSSNEFAKPYEQLRLLQAIENHHVVLLLMGHGHSARHERWGSLDSVMGGETWRENTGYNIISVVDGILRVVYRYRDPVRGMQLLLEKPLARQPSPGMRITMPSGRTVHGQDTPVLAAPDCLVSVNVTGGAPKRIVATLDNEPNTTMDLEPVDGHGIHAHPNRSGTYRANLVVGDMLAGAHFVHVTAEFESGRIERAKTIVYEPADAPVAATRFEFRAGIRAQPLLLPTGPIVATTEGLIRNIEQAQHEMPPMPAGMLGVEILHPAACGDNILYVSAAEKGVCALGIDGRELWRCDVGAVVYGTPALDADRIYVGDLEGFVHALDRKNGTRIWSRRHAEYSIEQPLLLRQGMLYFGAWDGYVYAIQANDGTLLWKQPGPAGHRAQDQFKSRYYAPGDCPPIVIGDRLFVVDRAYVLGSYSLSGEYLGEIADGVSGIGAAHDGKHFYTRGVEKGLARYDGRGERIWSNPIPLGRFPIPPTEAGNVVYACSNRGLLAAVDAEEGKILWRYQVTPQLPVMAPVAADVDGNVYVAGMDGTVTRLRPKTD